MSSIHSISTTLTDQSPKGVFEKNVHFHSMDEMQKCTWALKSMIIWNMVPTKP
jgi:hypothetical protein